MMRITLLVITCSLGVSCAPSPGPSYTPPTTREKCTANSAFCDGNTAKVCDQHGKVSQRIECTTSQTCVDGACLENVICQANMSICVRNTLTVCNATGTGFSSEQDCGTLICANGSCQDPGGNTCIPSVDYCVDNTAYQCNDTGTGLETDPQPCGQQLCINGSCQAVVCTPGAADCQDQTARTCNAFGTGYSALQVCQQPKICVLGHCQELVCTPGDSCVNNVAIHCNPEGTHIISQQDCAPNSCQGGRCVSADASVPDHPIGADATAPDRRQVDATAADQRAVDTRTADTGAADSGADDRRTTTGPCSDGDNDHYGRGSGCWGRDCDDGRADIHAGAEEFCDGVDNNCDGSVDENCQCAASANPRDCPTQGSCAANNNSQQTCSDGRWTACPVRAQEETCDGEDNDCNGLVDDVLAAGESCTVGSGDCERQGNLTCHSSQQVVYCNAGDSSYGIEICSNGEDDNCDGQTDEALCCPLRTSIDPATQECRRDERGNLCQSCDSQGDCGSRSYCVSTSEQEITCTGLGQGSCPQSGQSCKYKMCYTSQSCPGNGTCQGDYLPILPGWCNVGLCSSNICGLDCSDNKPCPAGFFCSGIYLVEATCDGSDCPSNNCQDGTCTASGESCSGSNPCPEITCVEGGCQIGKNCLPAEGFTCDSIPQDPPCGASCGVGAVCSSGSCQAVTSCSSTTACALGQKCVSGSCSAAERCQDNSDCDQPNFFCNSGYCDNADPCTGNGDCPDLTYCDLSSNPSICRPGCRLSSPSGCDSLHTCNSQHQCMLNNIVPGGRCAPCQDHPDCTEPGTFCTPLLNRCSLSCFNNDSICQSSIVPESTCLTIGCTNPDCPL